MTFEQPIGDEIHSDHDSNYFNRCFTHTRLNSNAVATC